MMTENLIGEYDEPAEVPSVVATTVIAPAPILSDLRDVCFKLRAFTETREGDLGLGVELGMQRAADMIESVIARYEPEGE